MRQWAEGEVAYKQANDCQKRKEIRAVRLAVPPVKTRSFPRWDAVSWDAGEVVSVHRIIFPRGAVEIHYKRHSLHAILMGYVRF